MAETADATEHRQAAIDANVTNNQIGSEMKNTESDPHIQIGIIVVQVWPRPADTYRTVEAMLIAALMAIETRADPEMNPAARLCSE
ncbi:hypothetical protein brsh051_18760 [Brooklawnia propionicigenes]|uniref:Uncharacterized protein n=1 Tax=Brooklawnia propionicigenes TaxID=3041175 RepID=A0AAN0KIN8_9ACTN|nr:hypothetical protein brsh051_18760 [Brooklawnia sp. SH051]